MSVLEQSCKKQTRRKVGNADKSLKEIICVEVPSEASNVPLFIACQISRGC
jgi:hypothetical protein